MSREQYNRNKNQKLAVDFVPPDPDPVIERAFSQLTLKQLLALPRLFVCNEPWLPSQEIESDCQIAANHYGYAIFFCDPEGLVLAYRDPE